MSAVAREGKVARSKLGSPNVRKSVRMGWISAGAGLVGLCTVAWWPPAAVALTFLAFVMAIGANLTVDVPATQIPPRLVALAHGAALYLGSGSVFLGLAGAIPLFLGGPGDRGVGRLGYRVGYALPVVVVIGLAMLALAWPTGMWGLAAAPSLLMMGYFSFDVIRSMHEMRRQGPSAWPTRIGERVPALRAQARDGSSFDLERERGRHVLLCFLRGDWCPICQVMMRIYKSEAKRLAEHGVKLVAVSRQSGQDAVEFARDLGLDYTILVDPEGQIARDFGALHQKGARDGSDTALPASFLIDPEGVLMAATRSDDVSVFFDPKKVVDLLGK